MISKTCVREGCDVVFESYPSQNRKYCSNSCRYSCSDYRDSLISTDGKHVISKPVEWARRGTCSICGPNVPIRRRGTDSWRCNVPTKINQRKNTYNLAAADFIVMQQLQTDRCAICRKPFDAANVPHVDHDHACCDSKTSCGECVRGLLCRRCNTGIAMFSDDIEILTSAIQYLRPWLVK